MNISPRLQQIAKLAKEHPERAFTTLAHHIDLELLREAYRRTRKNGATGVDGVSGAEYAQELRCLSTILRHRSQEFIEHEPQRRPLLQAG